MVELESAYVILNKTKTIQIFILFTVGSPFFFSGLMEILPDRCTMIAKKELVYAGTVGLICWLGGIVFINRKKTSDAKSVMAEAAQTMLDQQVRRRPC